MRMMQVNGKSSGRRAMVTCALLLGTFMVACFRLSVSGIAMAQEQRGKASYYSKKATGARTASGLRLHHDSMTCAHRTFPFGTMLKVTNLTNGKTVVVKVTDRGPYGRGRIIDLSWGAAKAIGMLMQGVVPVVVERLKSTVYPLRPEDENPDLPEFDFEIADIAIGITPVWQEMELDSVRVAKQMNKTVQKAKQKKTANQQTNGNAQNSQKKMIMMNK